MKTMKTRSPAPAVLVAVLVAVAVLALGGCGGEQEKKADARAEGTPTTALAAPGERPTVQVDEAAGSITITNEDGASTVGKGLPASFPSDVIPLVPGEVVGSTTGKAGGPYAWTVLIQVREGTPAAVMARATRALTGAGFQVTPGMSVPEMSTGVFAGRDYEVGVNAVKAEDKVTVTYVVKKA